MGAALKESQTAAKAKPRRAQGTAGLAMPTTESEREGAAFMAQMAKDAVVALEDRIERQELLPSAEIQARLQITRQSLSIAVKAGRLFAIVGPSGKNYYPAFYADSRLDRRYLEKVCRALGGLPGTVKYHFFTSKSFYLGSKTPLEALVDGRLADVMVAATACAER